MAAHCPVQLMPFPQVTLVNFMSGEQQPTSIDSLENVKEESKKSTFVVLALPEVFECKALLKSDALKSHSFNTFIDKRRHFLSKFDLESTNGSLQGSK